MLSRRHFLTNTAMLGSAAGFAATPLSSAVAAAVDDLETTTWSCCSINCGSRCLLRCVSKKGRVIRIETDNTGDPEAGASATSCPQVRACQRGRSIRQRLYSEERLKFPMKRVGRRGEGKFGALRSSRCFALRSALWASSASRSSRAPSASFSRIEVISFLTAT